MVQRWTFLVPLELRERGARIHALDRSLRLLGRGGTQGRQGGQLGRMEVVVEDMSGGKSPSQG